VIANTNMEEHPGVIQQGLVIPIKVLPQQNSNMPQCQDWHGSM